MCSIYQNSTRTRRVPCNLLGSDGWAVSVKIPSVDGASGAASFFSPAVEAVESRCSASSGLGPVTWEVDALICWAQLAGHRSSAIATYIALLYVLLISRFRHGYTREEVGFKLKLECLTFFLSKACLRRTSSILGYCRASNDLAP